MSSMTSLSAREKLFPHIRSFFELKKRIILASLLISVLSTKIKCNTILKPINRNWKLKTAADLHVYRLRPRLSWNSNHPA